MSNIQVVDLFAGPGGLSHGFHTFRRNGLSFSVALSIEKDGVAYRTLHLRAFARHFAKLPSDYYAYIRNPSQLTREILRAKHPDEWHAANSETRQWELGKRSFEEVSATIGAAVSRRRDWVLLGGPPCQAYSLAGRARMKNDEAFAQDHRHLLYREYLKIVAVHQPPIFVMENVKGILSAVHGMRAGQTSIFEQIIEDLSMPSEAVRRIPEVAARLPNQPAGYRIYSFVSKALQPELLAPRDFVIRSEDWGIPQTRHRVVLLGVRNDIDVEPRTLGELFARDETSVGQVIDTLPRLRSRLSGGDQAPTTWIETLRATANAELLNEIEDARVRSRLKEVSKELTAARSTGKVFIAGVGRYKPAKLSSWLWDARLGGVIQHESRAHMASDLQRYFFATCAAAVTGKSPNLGEYPKALLPNHSNVQGNEKKHDFADRFRVQVIGKPASTITSHISKDGHYYIHYDPSQCRSLTVREAARLQTFPDTYFFEGNRTQQYQQVGNAVPPLLAHKLATVVADLFIRSKTGSGDSLGRS